MKIALDAMGGDFAPAAIVEGAVQFLREDKTGTSLILVGDRSKIEKELDRLGAASLNFTIHHASETIEMGESPLFGLRKKKDSSISVAAQLVKEGSSNAVVSAGNTGAVVMATKLKLRFLEGVERPAIATILPNRKGKTVLLDLGANTDCRPMQLVHFALMGNIIARDILGLESPRVGLLSIGEEESKGNDLTREAFKMLEKAPINFIGNVEGRDVYSGTADVVVMDGFVGNVVLKVSESLSTFLVDIIKKEIYANPIRKLGGLLLSGAFRAIGRKADYAEYGGTPLIGVNGTCIICHGRSNPKAIKNALRVAREFVDHNVDRHIINIVKQYNNVILAQASKSVQVSV
ncbi:MAG TPA: phosphate acyltransferase PlsX [bacterium]|nr:phosphate acyltransferase PlsX [bacterium]